MVDISNGFKIDKQIEQLAIEAKDWLYQPVLHKNNTKNPLFWRVFWKLTTNARFDIIHT